MPPDCATLRPDNPNGDRHLFAAVATTDDVRLILAKVMDSVPPTVSPDATFVLELVLAEALNNIVEHAFAPIPEGHIEIGVTVHDARLTCAIRDNGLAMPGELLPRGHLPDLDVETSDLPEGGFGWHMIRSLTSDLTYCRSDGFNLLTFSVPAI